MPDLVDFSIEFLEKSWEWLNDPVIKALTMTPDFTREDQENFFKNLPYKDDYWIRGITENNLPIGVMGLKHITGTTAAYWGYIGEKEYWGKGIGSFMIQEAVKKAGELGLQQLYLEVDELNHRARQLYIKKGFKPVAAGKTEKYILSL